MISESLRLFPSDEPLTPGELIGRSGDVASVSTSLAEGINIVLVGPRRTGKTSVADAAVEACRRTGAYTATVDLFLLADPASLATELTVAVLRNRSVLARAIERANRAPEHLLEALSTTATLRARADLGTDLEISVAPSRADRDPVRALRAAFELPQRIAEADGRRIVLFFDEFQELAGGRFGDPDVVTKQLRAVLQRSRQVSTLFAGSLQHVMRDLFGPSERALSQFGSFHDLAEISTEEWLAGLRSRFERGATHVDDEALGRIVGVGEGHPRSTMLIAQQAHVHMLEQGERALTDATVDAAVRRAMQSDRLRHQQTLEQIHAESRFAQRIAERVARGQPPYSGVPAEQARRALRGLAQLGVLTAGDRRGEWFITEPLLRRYLSEQPGDRAG